MITLHVHVVCMNWIDLNMGNNPALYPISLQYFRFEISNQKRQTDNCEHRTVLNHAMNHGLPHARGCGRGRAGRTHPVGPGAPYVRRATTQLDVWISLSLPVSLRPRPLNTQRLTHSAERLNAQRGAPLGALRDNL